ncbi:caspase, EACC1-associated type [Actinophytocola sp.]|uniref:caspase, EACC1-associated type n=1 Tax=Actinophytocola sp. TaxID=1872138 RepID=UPI003899BC46
MAGARSALIVASANYTDPELQQLRAPSSDAEALAAVLSAPDIGGFDVHTLLDQPAHDIALAVEEFFADRHPDDLLLAHFSCHGVKDEEGELYFATTNTRLRRLGATAVAADFVNRRMNRSRCRRIVLLLDCCYAGAFERGITSRAGGSIGIETQFGGRGRAVITASSAMEYAFEDSTLVDTTTPQPSVFTGALVRGLATGDADRDQDGIVALDELYDYVYDAVRASTSNQTPGKWMFNVQGELHIARRAYPVTTPAPLPSQLADAATSPFASIRAAAVTELTNLLHGRHAGLALAARTILTDMQDDDSRTVAAAATTALADAVPAATTSPTTRLSAPANPQPHPPTPATPTASTAKRRASSTIAQHEEPTVTSASTLSGPAAPLAEDAPAALPSHQPTPTAEDSATTHTTPPTPADDQTATAARTPDSVTPSPNEAPTAATDISASAEYTTATRPSTPPDTPAEGRAAVASPNEQPAATAAPSSPQHDEPPTPTQPAPAPFDTDSPDPGGRSRESRETRTTAPTGGKPLTQNNPSDATPVTELHTTPREVRRKMATSPAWRVLLWTLTILAGLLELDFAITSQDNTVGYIVATNVICGLIFAILLFFTLRNRRRIRERGIRYRPDHAASLLNLAINLGTMGRWGEALAKTEVAVEHYRELAEAEPDRYRAALATSLYNLAIYLREAGRLQEALVTSQEALTIRRELAEAEPDRYCPDLAASLHNLVLNLRELDDTDSAIRAHHELVSVWRACAERAPELYGPAYQRALGELRRWLNQIGRHEEPSTLDLE